jgi:hypothetical protein
MLRDPGSYEERYRLTGGAALTLAASLLSIGLGVLWHMPVISAVIAVLIAAQQSRAHGLLGAARRMIAFRADPAGITLAAVPGRLPSRHGAAVFIPWTDVEQIILYRDYPRGLGRLAQFQCIGIQCPDRATAPPQGSEQDPHRPAPGAAPGVYRRIIGWRLDREHLATVTAAVAPGIPIIDDCVRGCPQGPAALAQRAWQRICRAL